MTFIAACVLYVLFSYAFAALLPLLFEGIGGLIRFLALALGLAFVAIVKSLALLLLLLFRMARLAGRSAWMAGIFAYFLAAEILRGDEPEGSAAGAEDDDADLYQAALTLLGLPPRFTRAELDAAFKKAIRKAHPDAGGSVGQAQAVNTARDLLLPHAL